MITGWTWKPLGSDHYRVDGPGWQAEVVLTRTDGKWRVEVLTVSGRVRNDKNTRKWIECFALEELAPGLRLFEVAFQERTGSKTQCITVWSMPGESAQEAFERECRRLCRSWIYVSDEEIPTA
jgi:hypothetical protein